MSMSSNSTIAGIVEGAESANTIQIQCLPLSTMILALGNPRVDFLSLDIEGAEFDVLKNMLWEKIDIRAIAVETQFADEFNLSDEQFDTLLQAQGFQFLDKISRDSVYVQVPRPDLLLPRRNLPTQSRKVAAQELLTRGHYPFPHRICQMFHVEKENLATHCKIMFPFDYFRDIDIGALPPCMTNKQCLNTMKELVYSVQCARSPWKTLLSDGCNLIQRNF